MKRYLSFIPAIIFYLFIFYLSSRDLKIDMPGSFFDKVAHLLEFAALAFLLSLGYFTSLRSSLKTKVLLIFVSGLILGALDEIHQSFVPGRQSDPWDVIADILGIALGIFLYWYLAEKRKSRFFGS